MKTHLTIVFIGNLIDTAATLYLTAMGYHELNPVMRPLLQAPVLFVMVKLCAMGCAMHILWRNRAHRNAELLAWIAAAVYGAIAVYYGVWFAVM